MVSLGTLSLPYRRVLNAAILQLCGYLGRDVLSVLKARFGQYGIAEPHSFEISSSKISPCEVAPVKHGPLERRSVEHCFSRTGISERCVTEICFEVIRVRQINSSVRTNAEISVLKIATLQVGVCKRRRIPKTVCQELLEVVGLRLP